MTALARARSKESGFVFGGVRFIFLGWNIPGWRWVRLAWLGFWEAKQYLGKKIEGCDYDTAREPGEQRPRVETHTASNKEIPPLLPSS